MDDRLTVDDVLERLDDDEFGLDSGEESDAGGDEIGSYLPLASEDLSGHVVGAGALEGEVSDSDGDDAAPGPSTSYLSDGSDVSQEAPTPSRSSTPHQASDSGRSRSGRLSGNESSESDTGHDVVYVPGHGRPRGGRYRGGVRGRPSIRRSGRGRRSGIAGGSSRGSVRGSFRSRGRGRGVGTCSRTGDGLTDRQREVLVEGWKKQENVFTNFTFQGASPGPTTPSTGESASACFSRFFTDEVWDLLVRETNRFAAQVRASITSPSARPWHDVDEAELKAFVGVMMAMGICRLPRLEMYWSTTHSLITPEIRKVMSLKRFQQIWRFFHTSDNNKQVPYGQPGYDPLFKVRPLLDLVAPRCESEYYPHEQLCIDEAMIKFKGRLGFKQYMKAKPTKWGIKVFVLSDSINGYVFRFQIYSGKNSCLGSSEFGLCTQSVLSLMHGIENRCHKVFMDNYYTSPALFLTLYDKKVQACGTARTSRKYYPRELAVSDRGKERGWSDHLASPPLLACAWKDRRIINFLSTMHTAAGSATVPRTVLTSSGQVTSEEVSCPPLLPDYQAYMRGVDRGDQLMGYYNIGRRSKKWWKRVFGYVIEVAALNAYIIQKDGRLPSPKKHDYLEFRISLLEELVGTFSSRRVAAGRPRSVEHQQALRLDPSQSHLPVYEDKQHQCVVCNTVREKRNLKRSECRHETRVKCSVCDVNLCLTASRNCFLKYHTVVRFWE